MQSERELTERLYFIIMRLPSREEAKEVISLIKRGANVLDVMNRIHRVMLEQVTDKIRAAVYGDTGTGALLDYVRILEDLIEYAKAAGYGKLCPHKTDRLQKIVENRDKINIEHVLAQKLPSDVTKKVMNMTKDKKGGKTLKKKHNKKGKKTCHSERKRRC